MAASSNNSLSSFSQLSIKFCYSLPHNKVTFFELLMKSSITFRRCWMDAFYFSYSSSNCFNSSIYLLPLSISFFSSFVSSLWEVEMVSLICSRTFERFGAVLRILSSSEICLIISRACGMPSSYIIRTTFLVS